MRRNTSLAITKVMQHSTLRVFMSPSPSLPYVLAFLKGGDEVDSKLKRGMSESHCQKKRNQRDIVMFLQFFNYVFFYIMSTPLGCF